MKKLFVIESLFVDGVLAEAGSVLEVSPTVAVALVQTGRARLATEVDAKPKPPVETATEAPAPENTSATPVKKTK